MALSLKASQQNLYQLFETSERYIIPEFQRPYSWGFDECYQLYMDLISAFRRDKEDYFLGNILLARGMDDNKRPLIIDGQQRMVTLMIVMKVLSTMFPNYVAFRKMLCVNLSLREMKVESKIYSQIQEVEDQRGIDSILGWDYGYFYEHYAKIDGKQSADSSTNVVEYNSLLIFRMFEKFRQDNEKELEDFCDYLLEHVYILPIELTGDTVSAATSRTLTIFETLNNRGLDLDDAHIFKARLYAMAKRLNIEKAFQEHWTQLNDTCSLLKIKLDDVFRYYSHIIRAENGITSSEINLRNFFVGTENAPLIQRGVVPIVKDLEKIMDVLLYIESIRKQNSSLTKWLQVLEAYTNGYPMYALVVYLYVYGTDDESGIEEFIQYLIRLCYMYGTSSSIKFTIYNLIKNIYIHKDNLLEIDKSNLPNIIDRPKKLRNGLLLLLFYLQNPNHVLLSYTIKKHYTGGDIVKFIDYDDLLEYPLEMSLENYSISGKITQNSDAQSSPDIVYNVYMSKRPQSCSDFVELHKENKEVLENFFMED